SRPTQHNSWGILSSCEPELQELMRQIDIMINDQKKKWEDENRALELRVKSREEELLNSRSTIERRDLEIGLLRKQLEDVKTGPQELAAKYEQQLHKLREEVRKLVCYKSFLLLLGQKFTVFLFVLTLLHDFKYSKCIFIPAVG
uniref:CEP63/Deup1 N-terminal domain-containing protein n=1 Tax=Neolamprologus brichardi TaxID=32507 RepID=A0A3Q4HBS9_NEOBR